MSNNNPLSSLFHTPFWNPVSQQKTSNKSKRPLNQMTKKIHRQSPGSGKRASRKKIALFDEKSTLSSCTTNKMKTASQGKIQSTSRKRKKTGEEKRKLYNIKEKIKITTSSSTLLRIGQQCCRQISSMNLSQRYHTLFHKKLHNQFSFIFKARGGKEYKNKLSKMMNQLKRRGLSSSLTQELQRLKDQFIDLENQIRSRSQNWKSSQSIIQEYLQLKKKYSDCRHQMKEILSKRPCPLSRPVLQSVQEEKTTPEQNLGAKTKRAKPMKEILSKRPCPLSRPVLQSVQEEKTTPEQNLDAKTKRAKPIQLTEQITALRKKKTPLSNSVHRRFYADPLKKIAHKCSLPDSSELIAGRKGEGTTRPAAQQWFLDDIETILKGSDSSLYKLQQLLEQNAILSTYQSTYALTSDLAEKSNIDREKAEKAADEIYQLHSSKQPCPLLIGWKEHAVSAILYKDHLILGNKGSAYSFEKEAGCTIYPIKRPLTPQKIQSLLVHSLSEKKKAEAALEDIAQTNAPQYTLKMQEQKIGNCTYINQQAGLFGLLTLLKAENSKKTRKAALKEAEQTLAPHYKNMRNYIKSEASNAAEKELKKHLSAEHQDKVISQKQLQILSKIPRKLINQCILQQDKKTSLESYLHFHQKQLCQFQSLPKEKQLAACRLALIESECQSVSQLDNAWNTLCLKEKNEKIDTLIDRLFPNATKPVQLHADLLSLIETHCQPQFHTGVRLFESMLKNTIKEKADSVEQDITAYRKLQCNSEQNKAIIESVLRHSSSLFHQLTPDQRQNLIEKIANSQQAREIERKLDRNFPSS